MLITLYFEADASYSTNLEMSLRYNSNYHVYDDYILRKRVSIFNGFLPNYNLKLYYMWNSIFMIDGVIF